MKLYNTLTREKDAFEPLSDTANVFVCGPTVYDYSHIGHGKTYTQFDIIIRYLRWKGYDLFYLMNITDIDDKIIKRADERDRDWKALAEEYEAYFKEDMEALGNTAVDEYARATDHVDAIIDQVQRLIDKGYAYEISDGYYFEIEQFKDYGKLSNQDLNEIKAGARVDVNEEKKNPADFCIWKKHKPGEPYWDSPWGKGRPGWHIEDTAITETYFGPQYDLHGGAEDLIFPHHESEIAQQEAASGKKPLVKYWLHTAFLNIKDEKMSKSLGNIISIRDAIDDWGADTLRYYYAVNHYRTPLEYSEESLQQAQQSLKRFNNFIQDLLAITEEGHDEVVDERVAELLETFEKRMDNDFDTPGVTAALFDFMKAMRKRDLGTHDADNILAALEDIDQVLNIFNFTPANIPDEVQELVEARETARQNENWEKADTLREQIEDHGYVVEDRPDGSRVKPA
jgi:cysteinyl-tRNA synthetase